MGRPTTRITYEMIGDNYGHLFSVPVACTTLTVNKCQAALRTLQAFPYFYPTCLCREPSSDPACNAFREYLFDHPCSFVKEKGEFFESIHCTFYL